MQEQSLERTEVGYPEFVEQTLQHNAEIVRAICVACPSPTQRTSPKSSFTPCIASRKLGHAPNRLEPLPRSTLNLGDFYAIFTDLRIEGGWRPIRHSA